MVNKYNCRQALMNQLRKLWAQHVYWTRFFIVSTVKGLDDIESVTNRLLQNPDDFAQLLAMFYGTKTAQSFASLFRNHLLIAADLVNAAKAQDAQKADDARKRWYQNADEIAKFLADINPYWNEKSWRKLLHDHLEMMEKEAMLYLEGDYAESIKQFAAIEEQAMKMADYMFDGIVKQCHLVR